MLVPPPGDGGTLGCTVKILDMGLGRALFEEGGAAPDSGLTTEGVLLGTPDYMSPEQARDPRAADIRSDVYSLGCVLYHALSGQPPFPDVNIISQMIRHATEAPRPLREFNPAVPDGLQQIVGWMMAKDPAGRYPTPARAAGALEVYLAAEKAPPSSPEQDPGMRSYLTWLEGESAHDEPAPSDSGPVLTPPTPPPPTGKSKSKPALPAARADKPAKGERRARHKKKRPPPVVQGGAAPEGSGERFDVELVAVPPLPAGRAAGLTRRDFVMFFAGVGSGLAAYAVGWGLAALLGRTRSKEQE
jgi:serine/threonine protein kinase